MDFGARKARAGTGVTSGRILLLLGIAVAWGVNWPITKVAINQFPPLSFRAACVLLALPVLALTMRSLRVPLAVPRNEWPQVFKLACANMLVWNLLLMYALPHLPSGRCAALAYTMPIFSAVWSRLLRKHKLMPMQWVGIGCGGLAMILLVADEATALTGAPGAVLMVLAGAAVWGLGTLWLRDGPTRVHFLAVTFWSTAATGLMLGLLALSGEWGRWERPGPAVAGAVAFNALLIFGLCQGLWFWLARTLPLTVSTLSTLLVPLVGTVSGALMLHEHISATQAISLMLIVFAVGIGHWANARGQVR